MAEINLGDLLNGHKALVNEHDQTKGRLTAAEGTVEKFAEFIATADDTFSDIADELNGVVDTTTGEIQVAGIKPRLDAIDERNAVLDERLKRVEQRKAAGQPHWFRISDPDVAAQLLAGIQDYYDRVLRYEVTTEAPLDLKPCWQWHPRVVGILLAAACQDAGAYGGVNPREVLETWRVYTPFVIQALNRALTDCQRTRTSVRHRESWPHPEEADRTHDQWHVDLDQLPAYLSWWCGSREGIPPGLSPS